MTASRITRRKSASLTVSVFILWATALSATPIAPVEVVLATITDPASGVTFGRDTGFMTGSNPAFPVAHGRLPDLTTKTETRTMMEFDVSGFVYDGSNGFLNLYLIGGIDSVGSLGGFENVFFDAALVPSDLGLRTTIDNSMSVDVYAYNGDGILEPSDHDIGAFLMRYTQTETGLLSLDLSSALIAARSRGETWFGLNLRPVIDPDRIQSSYFYHRPPNIGSAGDIPPIPPLDLSPILSPPSAMPEPSTLFLLGTGLLGLVGYRRKKRRP